MSPFSSRALLDILTTCVTSMYIVCLLLYTLEYINNGVISIIMKVTNDKPRQAPHAKNLPIPPENHC